MNIIIKILDLIKVKSKVMTDVKAKTSIKNTLPILLPKYWVIEDVDRRYCNDRYLCYRGEPFFYKDDDYFLGPLENSLRFNSKAVVISGIMEECKFYSLPIYS